MSVAGEFRSDGFCKNKIVGSNRFKSKDVLATGMGNG